MQKSVTPSLMQNLDELRQARVHNMLAALRRRNATEEGGACTAEGIKGKGIPCNPSVHSLQSLATIKWKTIVMRGRRMWVHIEAYLPH